MRTGERLRAPAVYIYSGRIELREGASTDVTVKYTYRMCVCACVQ